MKITEIRKDLGFSLVEMMFVLAIILIVLSIGTYWYNSVRSNAALKTTTDSIVSALEKARSNSINGKNGQSYGVQFASTSYTLFSGNTYNSSNASNTVFSLDSSLITSNSLASSSLVILFSKLTGAIGSTATVTISKISDPSDKKTIIIESAGNVNVIQ